MPWAAARLGARAQGAATAAPLQGHELTSARLLPGTSGVSDPGDAPLAVGTAQCSLSPPRAARRHGRLLPLRPSAPVPTESAAPAAG